MKKNDLMLRRSALAMLAAACCSAFAAPNAPVDKKKAAPTLDKPWPTKPIKLVVGFPAGSVQDISARIIAEPLSAALGQPVIVENKVGASGAIAAAQVAQATDVHTFGVMNNSQLTIAKLLNPSVTYDPAKDLAPVALIATAPLVLVVGPAAPGNNPAQWMSWLNSLGTKGNFGSPGIGTPGHLGMELVKSKAGGAEYDSHPVSWQPTSGYRIAVR